MRPFHCAVGSEGGHPGPADPKAVFLVAHVCSGPLLGPHSCGQRVKQMRAYCPAAPSTGSPRGSGCRLVASPSPPGPWCATLGASATSFSRSSPSAPGPSGPGAQPSCYAQHRRGPVVPHCHHVPPSGHREWAVSGRPGRRSGVLCRCNWKPWFAGPEGPD